MFRGVKDSQWSADHIARHGVTLGEVREGTTLIYGRTHAGRYLLVVARPDQDEAFVITARDMTAGEKKTFQRKAH